MLRTCLIWLSLFLAATAAQAQPALRFAQTETGRVAYRVFGHGEKTLVFMPGLGDDMDSLLPVAKAFSSQYKVVLYDRAGYGRSPGASGAHDAVRATRELNGVLDALESGAPVILIGHSIGGTYAYYAAATYPDRIAGVILVDARPPGFSRACETKGLKLCTIPGFLKAILPGGGPSEADGARAAEDQADGAGCTRRPVLVMVRSTAVPRKGGFEALWGEQQAQMAGACPDARLVIAPSGGHYVHNDARTWFLTEVRGFIGQIFVDPATATAR